MLLDLETASRELALSRREIERLVASGRLPSVKIGRARRIRREALEAFVAARETPPLSVPDRTPVGA